MTTCGSYDTSSTNSKLQSELQLLQTQVLLGWEKEARTLSWFGLKDGMSVLELGSGPGFFTKKLLEHLPNSSVTAVEINPVWLDLAKEYLQGRASKRLRIIEASIMDTGLPDNSIDFAIARFLFQYLPDPEGAAKEVIRLLKPGGKLAIIDTDKEFSSILEPPIPELEPIMNKVLQLQASKGGNGLIGRRLGRILQAVGFKKIDREAIIIHSDTLGIDVFLPQLDPERLLPMLQTGLVSKQELENMRASHQKFLTSPDPFILLFWLMACGEKPQ